MPGLLRVGCNTFSARPLAVESISEEQCSQWDLRMSARETCS